MKWLFFLLSIFTSCYTNAQVILVSQVADGSTEDYIMASGVIQAFEVEKEMLLADSGVLTPGSKLTKESISDLAKIFRSQQPFKINKANEVDLPPRKGKGERTVTFTFIDIAPGNDIKYYCQVTVTLGEEQFVGFHTIKDITFTPSNKIKHYDKKEVLDAIKEDEQQVEPPPVKPYHSPSEDYGGKRR